MAQVKEQTFNEWLRAMCDSGGIDGSRLQRLLVRAGADVTERTAQRWLSGETKKIDPDLTPYLLRALDSAPELSSVNVFAAYFDWLGGRDSNPQPTDSRFGHLLPSLVEPLLTGVGA